MNFFKKIKINELWGSAFNKSSPIMKFWKNVTILSYHRDRMQNFFHFCKFSCSTYYCWIMNLKLFVLPVWVTRLHRFITIYITVFTLALNVVVAGLSKKKKMAIKQTCPFGHCNLLLSKFLLPFLFPALLFLSHIDWFIM